MMISMFAAPAAFANSLDTGNCGGSIEANYSNQQIHINVRGSQFCKTIEVSAGSYDRKFPLGGTQGNYSGGFTIPLKDIPSGFNDLSVGLRSSTGAHQSQADFPFVVERGYSYSQPAPIAVEPTPMSPSDSCKVAAAEAVGGSAFSSVQYNGQSNSGNFKYTVTVGFWSPKTYSVVTGKDCSIKNKTLASLENQKLSGAEQDASLTPSSSNSAL